MNNLLVADSEINVSKSPFSAYPEEDKIFDGRLNRISLSDQMMYVNRGHIFGVDFLILEALSELEFATSRMVTQYLNLRDGIEITQEKVHNRLKFMSKINIITRFKFSNSESETNLRVYCLEQAGKYLLMSRNIESGWKVSDNTRPLDMMKEILSRNQVWLSFRCKLRNLYGYRINPPLKLIKSNRFFKPHLQIDINYENNIESILFEVIRSYPGYVEKTINRLKQYQEYYEFFVPSQEMPEPPQLVLVGEDDGHLLKIFKIIIKENITFKDMECCYTHDLRILDSEINKCFLRFNILPDGKNVQLKNLNYISLQLNR